MVGRRPKSFEMRDEPAQRLIIVVENLFCFPKNLTIIGVQGRSLSFPLLMVAQVAEIRILSKELFRLLISSFQFFECLHYAFAINDVWRRARIQERGDVLGGPPS